MEKDKGRGLKEMAVKQAYSDSAKALQLIEEAIKCRPESAVYAVEKAEILCELGQPFEALLHLRQREFDDPKLIAEEVEKIGEENKLDNTLSKESKERRTLEEFLEWGKKNGANLSNIKIVNYTKEFRGVHAARRMKAGTRILTIPDHLILNVHKAKAASELARKVFATELALDYPYATAIACLVHEGRQNPSHPWRLFAEMFPFDYSGFPYFFNEKEMKMHEVTSYFEYIKREAYASDVEHEKIKSAFEEFSITAKEYLALTTLVCSRNFYCPEEPEKHIVVPFADMFNYYADKADQTNWGYVPSEKSFAITARRDIRRGEIIAVNYGNKSSAKYLHYYAFIPPNNPHDGSMIKFNLKESDPLLAEKFRALASEDLYITFRLFYPDFNVHSSKNEKVLSYFRFAEYQGDAKKLKQFVDQRVEVSRRYRKVRVPALSAQNEARALVAFRDYVIKALAGYPASYEAEQKMLESDTGLTMNERNILTIRVTEQRLYHQLLLFLKVALQFAKLSKMSALQELKKVGHDIWFKPYIERTLIPLLK